MSTDYRALCAELLDEVAARPLILDRELIARARAALAEPVAAALQRPESFEFALDFLGDPESSGLRAYIEQLEARAALAQPEPEVVGPTDEELLSIAADCFAPVMIHYARAVLARWGHQPEPPAEGEVAELVAWLRQRWPRMAHIPNSDYAKGVRAADLLEQRHPAPVPVNEQLPGAEDCDAEGRCWWWRTDDADEWWELLCISDAREYNAGCGNARYTHWLPAHALPLPQGEVVA